jgi:type IV pilus assembly protein PilA
MLKKIREARQDDRGFTLIELMVVVLIIAILIAIAIPTFLGLRQRAQNRSAQSNLRNGLTAAKGFYTDNESYTGFTAVIAEGIEPPLTWVNGGGTNPVVGSVHIQVVGAAPSQEIVLSTESVNGAEFCIADLAQGATAGTVRGSDGEATFANCAGANPDW